MSGIVGALVVFVAVYVGFRIGARRLDRERRASEWRRGHEQALRYSARHSVWKNYHLLRYVRASR